MDKMMAKFEAHITMPREQSEKIENFAHEPWKFSQIDGDPVMGKKPYCYLTAYSTNAIVLMDQVLRTSDQLREIGIEVLRLKIERIIFDTKTGVDEISTREQ